ncbi:RNA polymerase sigma-37 (RpsB/SigB) subunit [Aneurinibacillus soli]|uniref:RNA polymerase sigma-B factor n=1 Tax=Aneurinibacillus soli TaxID=1500254 RepID=A0A0U4WHV3_9BACL|nr:sigma-70 family RNA polymerase sigma factor [Aneurinibacillus soli]PYE64286.1 RNA polymerase sigma-37 (RpsB/SigB) subunit [Aneurinibacillus soli]BAU28235.1 RNA polymerase sigma-B factor [Aneurinibacillus soli]
MNKEIFERCKVDKLYLEQFMRENENLIWFSIRKYIGEPAEVADKYRIDKDDLLQLGRLAMLKCIKRFDPDRRVKFSSFTVTAIVREVRCFLRDKTSVIRPTRSASELLNRIKQTICELEYVPSTRDIAELLDVDEQRVVKAMKVAGDTVYAEFDMPIPKRAEDDVIDSMYTQEILQDMACRMTDVEFNIVLGRLNGMSYRQLSEKCKVSKKAVVRTMRKAREVLRDVYTLMNELDKD